MNAASVSERQPSATRMRRELLDENFSLVGSVSKAFDCHGRASLEQRWRQPTPLQFRSRRQERTGLAPAVTDDQSCAVWSEYNFIDTTFERNTAYGAVGARRPAMVASGDPVHEVMVGTAVMLPGTNALCLDVDDRDRRRHLGAGALS